MVFDEDDFFKVQSYNFKTEKGTKVIRASSVILPDGREIMFKEYLSYPMAVYQAKMFLHRERKQKEELEKEKKRKRQMTMAASFATNNEKKKKTSKEESRKK